MSVGPGTGDWPRPGRGQAWADVATAKEFEDRVPAMDNAGEGEGKRRRYGGAGRMILL